MKARHGLGVGLVGLLLSTVTFAAAPVAGSVGSESAVAAMNSNNVMEEIIVKARHPQAASPNEVFTMQQPLDLLSEAAIRASFVVDLSKPEIELTF